MSDQGKWAKIWVSVLANPDLENLELHEWARWVRLIVFMKAHGTNGKLSFKPPFRALQNVLRVETFNDLKEVIINLPNFKWLEPLPNASHTPLHDDIGKHMITCHNWFKFQGDMSTERVKKFRQKQTVSPTVPSNDECNGLRREEKRRITSTSQSYPKSPSPNARSGPSAPLASVQDLTKVDMPDFDHEDFLKVGWISSEMPTSDFNWSHFDRAMTNEERVQTKMREKFYAQKKHWN